MEGMRKVLKATYDLGSGKAVTEQIMYHEDGSVYFAEKYHTLGEEEKLAGEVMDYMEIVALRLDLIDMMEEQGYKWENVFSMTKLAR